MTDNEPDKKVGKRRRRFIAGALCPQCGALDKITLDEGIQYCVACHYSASQPPAPEPVQKVIQVQDLKKPS